jgi:hypothetical protein
LHRERRSRRASKWKEHGITQDSMRQCRPLSLQDYDNGF